MGYKLLGFLVWQLGKVYLRRRMSGTAGTVAIAGLAVAVVGGAIVAQRQHASD